MGVRELNKGVDDLLAWMCVRGHRFPPRASDGAAEAESTQRHAGVTVVVDERVDQVFICDMMVGLALLASVHEAMLAGAGGGAPRSAGARCDDAVSLMLGHIRRLARLQPGQRFYCCILCGDRALLKRGIPKGATTAQRGVVRTKKREEMNIVVHPYGDDVEFVDEGVRTANAPDSTELLNAARLLGSSVAAKQKWWRYFAERAQRVLAPMFEHVVVDVDDGPDVLGPCARAAGAPYCPASPRFAEADLTMIDALVLTRPSEPHRPLEFHAITTDTDFSLLAIALVLSGDIARSTRVYMYTHHRAQRGAPPSAAAAAQVRPAGFFERLCVSMVAEVLRVSGWGLVEWLGCALIAGCDFFDPKTLFTGVGTATTWKVCARLVRRRALAEVDARAAVAWISRAHFDGEPVSREDNEHALSLVRDYGRCVAPLHDDDNPPLAAAPLMQLVTAHERRDALANSHARVHACDYRDVPFADAFFPFLVRFLDECVGASASDSAFPRDADLTGAAGVERWQASLARAHARSCAEQRSHFCPRLTMQTQGDVRAFVHQLVTVPASYWLADGLWRIRNRRVAMGG